MKKLLYLFIGLSISILSAFAEDLKFIQIDGLKFNPSDEASVKSFDTLIENINKQKRTDFVVFTGDNISKPDKLYLKEFFKTAKKIDAPIYIALGNKDVNKKKGLGKSEYIKIYKKQVRFRQFVKNPNYSFEKKGVQFIIADGSKEFVATPNGYYKPETLKWIETKLNKNSDKNVVILQHFPIIPPAIKDGYTTHKADEYLSLINTHKNVKAVFSGLYNINKEQEVDGILHVATKSAPEYRVIDIIDCETQSPVFWSTISK